MILFDILIIALILAAFSLSISVIVFLKKILEQADAVRKDIHQFVQKSIPVMNNLEEVTENANKIVTEVEGYWNEIDNSIKNVRKQISFITSLKSFRAAEYTAQYIIKNLKALGSGTSAFLNSYKHK
jgi:uncharacterized protein YoxC